MIQISLNSKIYKSVNHDKLSSFKYQRDKNYEVKLNYNIIDSINQSCW